MKKLIKKRPAEVVTTEAEVMSEPKADIVSLQESKSEVSRRTKEFELEKKIRSEIGKGKNDPEICQKLDIPIHILTRYKNRILERDRDRFENYDKAKIYSEYTMKAEQLQRELEEVRQKFRNRGQWTALVAAIKQKHEISKDLYKMGQDLGFIEKVSQEVNINSEMSFSTMTTEEVMKEVENERARLNAMAKSNVIEMRPELIELLEGDTAKIKKFIPSDSVLPPSSQPDKKTKKVKFKLKQKIKLRK